MHSLDIVNLFCAGLLAGIEFVVRFGVRGALNVPDAYDQIRLRQALVRRLRVLVPAVYGPALLSTVAVTAGGRGEPGFALRCSALAALLGFTAVTFAGTVPVNKALLEWPPGAPPLDWRGRIRRWERLDTVRALAAVTAFALLLAALAGTLTVG
ncbi:anthrone oxygenase family protein [Kitasatospora indigofera]|uniref:anthrone oxygenase family protein n=1 Tax=Kitasatospora indigofera TaxID=67307 RepID=UPI003636E061